MLTTFLASLAVSKAGLPATHALVPAMASCQTKCCFCWDGSKGRAGCTSDRTFVRRMMLGPHVFCNTCKPSFDDKKKKLERCPNSKISEWVAQNLTCEPRASEHVDELITSWRTQRHAPARGAAAAVPAAPATAGEAAMPDQEAKEEEEDGIRGLQYKRQTLRQSNGAPCPVQRCSRHRL